MLDLRQGHDQPPNGRPFLLDPVSGQPAAYGKKYPPRTKPAPPLGRDGVSGDRFDPG